MVGKREESEERVRDERVREEREKDYNAMKNKRGRKIKSCFHKRIIYREKHLHTDRHRQRNTKTETQREAEKAT